LFNGPDAGAGSGALAGFIAGFGWVLTFMGISYLFETRSLAHFLINSLYTVARRLRLIMGLWFI
jgi:hypothetical protein